LGLSCSRPKGRAWWNGCAEKGSACLLDLKLYDIPNTVRGAARSAAGMGVSLLTVHGYGGAAMVDAAVDGAGAETGILVVTVLTSFDASTLGVALGREVPEMGAEVQRLAQVATSPEPTASSAPVTRCGQCAPATRGCARWSLASGSPAAPPTIKRASRRRRRPPRTARRIWCSAGR
jgi:orotidine-5'-phosphate decarboxylase